MNIIDTKSKLDFLTTEILHQYKILETSYLELQKTSSEELLSMNSKNESLYNLVKQKEDIIGSLEKEVYRYKEANHKLTEVKDVQTENSADGGKFNIIRSQAKEITNKDKEIERLTKELVKQKELNSMKNSINLKMDHGWSPTSSQGPVPIIDEIKLDDKSLEDKPLEDDGSEELYIIKYRKKTYYRDNNCKVFTILENEDKGEYIGNWVKQESGKSKLIKI
tara:strand:+ start:133 stop:798 length:666 start_codon:yes stop_codon:yes gene_type:complete